MGMPFSSQKRSATSIASSPSLKRRVMERMPEEVSRVTGQA